MARRCVYCPRPTIPGLYKPMCQDHYNAWAFGTRWAKKIRGDRRLEIVDKATGEVLVDGLGQDDEIWKRVSWPDNKRPGDINPHKHHGRVEAVYDGRTCHVYRTPGN